MAQSLHIGKLYVCSGPLKTNLPKLVSASHLLWPYSYMFFSVWKRLRMEISPDLTLSSLVTSVGHDLICFFEKHPKVDPDKGNPPIFEAGGWWLNQPLWKTCSSKWVHLPQFSGGKKILKTNTQESDTSSWWWDFEGRRFLPSSKVRHQKNWTYCWLLLMVQKSHSKANHRLDGV